MNFLATHQQPLAETKPTNNPTISPAVQSLPLLIKQVIIINIIGTVIQIIQPHFCFQAFNWANSLPYSFKHHWS